MRTRIKPHEWVDSPDSYPISRDAIRLLLIVGLFFLLFVSIAAYAPGVYEWMDSVHPIVGFWIMFSIICVFGFWWFTKFLKR